MIDDFMKVRIQELIQEKLLEIEAIFAQESLTDDPLVTCVVRDGHNTNLKFILSNDNIGEVFLALRDHQKDMHYPKE